MKRKQEDNKIITIGIPKWYVYFICDILNNAEYQEREKHGKFAQGDPYQMFQYFPTKKSKQILWIKNFIRRQIDKEKTV